MRETVKIEVRLGTFPSQPAAYAHLWDLTAEEALERIEVVQGPQMETRLLHWFDQAQAHRIEDALGPRDTVVLIFPEAGEVSESPALNRLGRFSGSRVVPG